MFSCWWSIAIHLSFTAIKTQNLKYFGYTTLTFWGYVTSSFTWLLDLAYTVFLLVVHCNHTSILHRYGDITPQIWV